MNKLCVQILLVAVLSSVLYGADTDSEWWPAWRGPRATGVSPDGDPPVKWSESENVKWKVSLTGDGSNSSPIVWGDKIFFQTAVQTDKKAEAAPEPGPAEGGGGGRGRMSSPKPTNIYKFNVVCLDRKTGATVWEKTVCEVLPHEGTRADHGFASYTPLTDGTLLWANFGSRGVYCLNMDGNIKWEQDLGQMNARSGFGEGGSLALAGDKIILVRDHEGQSSIVALNKENGKSVWAKERDEQTSWTTPLIADVNDKLHVIVVGTNRTRCYDAANGNLIWECGGQTQNLIPTPVLGFGMVFCTSGFRGSALQAIKLGGTGDLTGTDAVVWHVDSATPYVPSPLLYGDRLYVNSVNKGVVSCYNAKTGKPHYVEQNLEEIKTMYASPVGAAGRVYITSREGVTYVLKDADSLEVLAVNRLDDGIDCSAAIIGGEMYLKGKKNFYCIAASK